MSRVSDDERAAIESSLRDGQSLSSIAQQFSRSKGTIFNIARQAGITLERSATNKATAARVDYSQAERLILLNELFDKARAMADSIDKPLELQQLTTAVAILIDKRRLEDGEATSRSEIHDNDSARKQLAARLDELAARRAARGDRELERGAS